MSTQYILHGTKNEIKCKYYVSFLLNLKWKLVAENPGRM